jgi:hypothetical protein
MRLATWFFRDGESILPFSKICADDFLLLKKSGIDVTSNISLRADFNS